MTNSKAIQFFNNLRPISVGFDSVFDTFEHMLDTDFNFPQVSNYPPYNIVKTGKLTYDIEVALAGYSKDDISVDYADNVLTVVSKKDEETKEVEDNNGILHKGIAKRNFSRTFTIADDVKVDGAELKDGLLRVSLEKIVPEGKKPRTIKIK
jgi:molecular chaperone IbpA